MGQQLGMVNVRGSVGDITYRRTKNGYKVGLKSPLNKEAMEGDSRFDNTRRANNEFGAAGRAGKLIRTALEEQHDFKCGGRVTQRLLALAMQVVKSDTVSDFGERNAAMGNASFLESFEFNVDTPVQSLMKVPPVSSIDRVTGKLKITFPAFTASNALSVAAGATHFNIVSAGCALDFDNQKAEIAGSESAYFPVTNTPVTGFSLTNTIGGGSEFPLMLAYGIRFYKFVNTKYYRMLGAEFNALRILAIDQI